MYIELHAASAFSFLRGASLPETLIERAAALGYPALALLDRDGVYGAPRFHQAAKAAGIRAIIGAELTMAPRARAIAAGAMRHGTDRRPTDRRACVVASHEGWRNLCRPDHAHEAARAERRRRAHARRFRGAHGGLVALAGRPLLAARALRRRRAARSAGRHLRPRRRSTSSCSGICGAIRKTTTTRCRDWPTAFRVPLVATGGVRFATPEERPLFDVLTSIREHTTLDAGRASARGQRRALSEAAGADGAAVRRSSARRSRATDALAERLQFTMNDLGYRFPRLSGAAGRDRDLVSAQDHRRRRARALPAVSRSRARADRARARSDREARSRRLLPDRLGHRQFLPAAGHPRAGARVGGQQRRVLQPRHHGRRSGRHGSAVRAVPVGGARRVARHRSRSAERRSARARHSARLREVRHARRRR